MEQDLGELMSQFLARPDSMEMIQSVLASLGGDMPKPDAVPPSPPAESVPDLGALQKLLPLLQGFGGDNSSDQHVALLRALRPYLHNGREKKVDEAIEMMRLAKLLPLLKGAL